MKYVRLWVLTATVVLSFATLSLAQAPLATPIAAMPEKGDMKGEKKDDMKDMKGGMKQSDGMMEKKSDTMMMKPSDGMMEKKSDVMMEKKK